MNSCKYCGRDNLSDAISCQECGTPFDDSADEVSLREIGSGAIKALKENLIFLLPVCDGMRKWLFVILGLILLGIALVLFIPRTISKTGPLRIVVLATRFTNNEQFVTFRAEPPTAEITFADMVPASYDDRFQPATIRACWDMIPVGTVGETNPPLNFVALPIRGASFGGTPVAYTPGSYTVAYTPTKKAHRLRAGIALQESGIEDYFRRIRTCWYQNSLRPLSMKSHQDSIFVTTGPLTNAGGPQ